MQAQTHLFKPSSQYDDLRRTKHSNPPQKVQLVDQLGQRVRKMQVFTRVPLVSIRQLPKPYSLHTSGEFGETTAVHSFIGTGLSIRAS